MSLRKLLALLLVAALLGGGAWLAQRRPAAPAGPQPAPVAGAAPATIDFAEADIVAVVAGPLSRSIPLTGTLKPVDQAVVKSKVAGDLSQVPVREGMAVKRGQLVARIDATEFEWRVREREAQLKSADSQLAQARRTLDNTQALHQKNFVSQSALDNARSAWEVALANRDAANAQLTLARKTLADTVMTAPLSGTVAERFAQPGEKVAVDGRILSIVDLSRMEIEAPVPAAEIGAVAVGQPVELRIEGIDAPQVGRIVRIAPATQAGTRSVPVWIALDNRDPKVRAGLFAQGRLAVETRERALQVPAAALREAAGRSFVYAIVDDRVVEREVTTGLRDEGARAPNGAIGVVEIRTGLAEGERIVAANLGTLRAGSIARIGPGAAAGSPAPRRAGEEPARSGAAPPGSAVAAPARP